MTARRELLILEVLARMNTVPGVALVVRQPNAQPTTSFTLALDDRGQQLIEAGAIHNKYVMTLSIAGFITGAASAPAINEFYAATIRALMIDGAQLGGMAELVTEGDLQIDVSATDQKTTTIFELPLQVQFIARTHDPALM